MVTNTQKYDPLSKREEGMCKAKTWVLGKARGLAVKQGIGRYMWAVNTGLQGSALEGTSQASGASACGKRDRGTSAGAAMQAGGVLLPLPVSPLLHAIDHWQQRRLHWA